MKCSQAVIVVMYGQIAKKDERCNSSQGLREEKQLIKHEHFTLSLIQSHVPRWQTMQGATRSCIYLHIHSHTDGECVFPTSTRWQQLTEHYLKVWTCAKQQWFSTVVQFWNVLSDSRHLDEENSFSFPLMQLARTIFNYSSFSLKYKSSTVSADNKTAKKTIKLHAIYLHYSIFNPFKLHMHRYVTGFWCSDTESVLNLFTPDVGFASCDCPDWFHLCLVALWTLPLLAFFANCLCYLCVHAPLCSL